MRNRYTGCSFKNTANHFPIHALPSLNRRRSCECEECGNTNKKMLYTTTILSQFQPYQHLIIKLREQNEKMQQRKQMKMRNRRHLIQKKTIIDILSQQQDNQPKRKNNRHHNTVFYNIQAGTPKLASSYSLEAVETPQKSNQRPSILLHRYNSLSPKKMFSDIKQSKISTFSQKLKTFYLPITAPFDCSTIFKLELIIDHKVKAVKQTGSQDDFEIGIRVNKFEEDDKQNEETLKEIPALPTLMQEEDEDEDEQTDDENLIRLRQFKVPNPKQCYKDILKFNKRSLKNLIDRSQLAQSNTVRQILMTGSAPKIQPESSKRIYTANMSPVSYCNTLSPNPSVKLLDEKKKRPGLKLLPLAVKPVSMFTFTNINSSPSVLSTKNSCTKKSNRNIINAPAKKHKKNITFGQLMIKI